MKKKDVVRGGLRWGARCRGPRGARKEEEQVARVRRGGWLGDEGDASRVKVSRS